MPKHVPDHTGIVRDIPDDVFDEGPDEDEAAEFRTKSVPEQLSEWQRWLSNPRNDLDTLVTARTARNAAYRPRGPISSNYVELTEKVTIPVDRKIRSIYASPNTAGNAPTTERVQVAIDRDDFDLGPQEYFTRYPDPNYATRTHAEKVQLWADALALSEYTGNRAKAILIEKAHVASLVPKTRTARCLDAMKVPGFKTNTGKKWTLVAFLVAGAIAAIATVVSLLNGRKLRTTVNWAANGKSILVVEWDAFDDVTDDGATYVVTLSTEDGTGIVGSKTTDRAGRKVEFLDLADGTYRVHVELVLSGENLSDATTTVTVAAPAMVATTPPGTPSAVTITVTPDAPMSAAGLTVSWTPSTTGDPATSYLVSLAGIAPPVDAVTETTASTTVSFATTAAGTYQATVTARNMAGDGTAAMSAVFTFAPKATAPNPPRNARAMPYKSTSGKAALLVRWDPPIAGAAVTGYRVLISGPTKKDPVITGATQSARLDDLDDGTYGFSVGSVGPGGESGPIAGAPITLAAATIDPDAIEWDVVFSPDEITKWKAANDKLTGADETTFWAGVIAAVEDTANDYGGPADFSEQLQLAKVLTGWITLPAAIPDDASLDDLSDRLTSTTTPPFPKQGPAMGQAPYANRSALWRAASTLQNSMGTADEVLRYKIFAIVRALDRYLAPLATHDRVYENDVLPPETRTLGPNFAIETAQRVDVLADGVVNGVWWYRIPQDSGTNTVSVWRAGSLLDEAAGDPGTTGWVSISFATPVNVAKGDQLIVGVHHPNGAYGVRENGLSAAPRTSTLGHLRLPASTAAAGNGLYDYVAKATLPVTTYLASEYFLTPDFTAT